MKQKFQSNQNGRTIMEMIAYIMIMVTLTAAVATMAHTGYHRYECSQVQLELADLKKIIVMRYAAEGNYKKINWNDLRESHMGPRNIMPTRDCSTQDCYGQHTFEGKIEIGTNDEYGETFYIEFQELPTDVCNQMGSKQWPSTDGSDLEKMKINDVEWVLKSQKQDNQKVLPAQTKDVVGACKEGYDNKIRWTFN